MSNPNFYLYHYYEEKTGPFRNLSALSPDMADQLMHKFKSEGVVFASQRPDDYLTIRRDLEARARDLFIQKGGKPLHLYPHYLTLGPCSWIKKWYTEGRELKIHIDEFDPEHISFTYGDLFPAMRFKDGKPYRGILYTKHEIIKIIEKYGFPQDWNVDGKLGPERYIEVQIWDDKNLLKYID
ncbi:MAG: hypothetical protein K6T94_12405 [Paenibacillus sp.]|nr:hypothetical protein [Paenibacillus sp.]